jgi:transposase
VAQHTAGLDVKPPPGGSPLKRSLNQRHHLIELLRRGARAYGFRNALWTLSRIATVIKRHFGVIYCPRGVWYLKPRLQWSPQKPGKRARKQDEQAIAKWPTQDWSRIKKARHEGRTIIIMDETGVMLRG